MAGRDIDLKRLIFALLRLALPDSPESAPTLLRKEKFSEGLRSLCLKLRFQREIPHDSETLTLQGVFASQRFQLSFFRNGITPFSLSGDRSQDLGGFASWSRDPEVVP